MIPLDVDIVPSPRNAHLALHDAHLASCNAYLVPLNAHTLSPVNLLVSTDGHFIPLSGDMIRIDANLGLNNTHLFHLMSAYSYLTLLSV